jgi:hypothetical protein
MKRLLLSALVLAAMSSTAMSAEPLTEQQMDTVTAGLIIAYATSEGLALSSINIETDQLSAVSLAIPGTTLVGQCAGDCTFNVNGRPESFTVCSTCTIQISDSGVTIKDVSGKILSSAKSAL